MYYWSSFRFSNLLLPKLKPLVLLIQISLTFDFYLMIHTVFPVALPVKRDTKLIWLCLYDALQTCLSEWWLWDYLSITMILFDKPFCHISNGCFPWRTRCSLHVAHICKLPEIWDIPFALRFICGGESAAWSTQHSHYLRCSCSICRRVRWEYFSLSSFLSPSKQPFMSDRIPDRNPS